MHLPTAADAHAFRGLLNDDSKNTGLEPGMLIRINTLPDASP